MQKRALRKFISFVVIMASTLPITSFAVQTGGGYIINDRITPAKGIQTAGGYTVSASAAPISNITTGGGYSSFGGGYSSITTPTPVVAPAAAGGGGGGGSGSSAHCLDGYSGVYPNCVLAKGSVGRKKDNHTFAQIRAETSLANAPYRVDPYPDNYIDIRDFNVVMVNWGKREGAQTLLCGDKRNADINCDGIVDVRDFNLLMVFWGKPVWPQEKMSWFYLL